MTLIPGVVRGRIETDISVVLPVDEARTRGGVVVDDPADAEGVDVAEAAGALLTGESLFLVVVPGEIVPEPVVGHGDAIVQRGLLLARGVLLGTDGVVDTPGGRGVVALGDGVGVEVGSEGLGSDGGGGGGRGSRLVVGLGRARWIRRVVRVGGDIDLFHVRTGGRRRITFFTLFQVVAERDGSHGRGSVVKGVGSQLGAVGGRHVGRLRLLVYLGVLHSYSALAGHLLRRRHGVADGRVDSYQNLLGSDDAVPLAVGYVVPDSEVAVGVDPPVGAHHSAILESLLLAVLPAEGLVLEVPLGSLVGLDVILRVGCRVPASYLGTSRSQHHDLQHNGVSLA